jgi:serine protease Do
MTSRMFLPISIVLAGSCVYAEPQPVPPPPPAPPDRVVIAQSSGGSFLGIGVTEVDAERAKALNLKEERGVEITRVEEDSPAARAGLKTGDVVLEYGGQRVEGTEQFVRLVHETPAGREVKISISRNGSMQTVMAKTGSRKAAAQRGWMVRPGDGFSFELPDVRMPDVPQPLMGWRNATLGIEGESVDSQLAQYFGVKQGVLVRSVLKGTAAEKAGLKAGDVITKVDSTQITSPRDISSALRPVASKNSAAVALTRERREMTINVAIEPDKQGADAFPPRTKSVRVHLIEPLD